MSVFIFFCPLQLQRLSYLDVHLKDETDASLLEATAHINNQTRAELEKLLTKADRAGKGTILRETWKQDVEDRLLFNKDQRQNGEKKCWCYYFLVCV